MGVTLLTLDNYSSKCPVAPVSSVCRTETSPCFTDLPLSSRSTKDLCLQGEKYNGRSCFFTAQTADWTSGRNPRTIAASTLTLQYKAKKKKEQPHAGLTFNHFLSQFLGFKANFLMLEMKPLESCVVPCTLCCSVAWTLTTADPRALASIKQDAAKNNRGSSAKTLLLVRG